MVRGTRTKAAELGLLAVALMACLQAGCSVGGRPTDPASVARLGAARITSVKPARVAPPASRHRPSLLVIKAALNTLYPTRDASRASIYRRFHWVQFSLSGKEGRAHIVSSLNDDRSHDTESGYQRASAWVEQYVAAIERAPALPASGQSRLIVTACDRDPSELRHTFCQRRSIVLCLKRGVIVGQPAEGDHVPRYGGLNSCRTPSFAGVFQSAASDAKAFQSYGE